MSDNRTKKKYEVVDLEFDYDKFVFEEEEYAAITVAEYKDNRSLIEKMDQALGGALGLNDSTPFQMYESPREVLVSKEKSDELQRTADQVLGQ